MSFKELDEHDIFDYRGPKNINDDAKQYEQFEQFMGRLDDELQTLISACGSIGGSTDVVTAASNLRTSILPVLFTFRRNAIKLKLYRSAARGPTAGRPDSPLGELPPGYAGGYRLRNLEGRLGKMKKCASGLSVCLNDFVERFGVQHWYLFESVLRIQILRLPGYLHGLPRFGNQDDVDDSIRMKIHHVAIGMSYALHCIVNDISQTNKTEIPRLSAKQKHSITNLVNIATVATLLSAVTISALGMSVDDHGTPLKDAVNFFYFASLVFSIAAAVNSVLGVAWKQAVHRLPVHQTPKFAVFWIRGSPLVFLIVAVLCFSIGLMLFAWSSHQSRITGIIIITLNAGAFSGLAVVTPWIISEHWKITKPQIEEELPEEQQDDIMMSILVREAEADEDQKAKEDGLEATDQTLVRRILLPMKGAKATTATDEHGHTTGFEEKSGENGVGNTEVRNGEELDEKISSDD